MNTTARPTRMGAPTVAPQQGALIEQPAQRAAAAPMVMAPAAPQAKAYPPKIAKALLYVARKIQPVEKAGINDFHKYAYPKWEDIRDELWPLVNEAGLIIIQNEKSHEGLTTDMIAITYDFTILNDDGDAWPDKPEVTAICKIRDNKGTLDDKAASKCRTQAEKNAMVQIFKIRTEDVYEVDQSGRVSANSPRRVAPSPDGAFKPHEIPVQKDETADAWGERFKAMLKHAKTPEVVDEWYAANKRVFDRLESNAGYAPLYEALIGAMDARVLEVAPKQEQQEQQALPQTQSEGFPGDKPMSAAATMPDIPQNLRRAPAPPGAQQAISAAHQQWLAELETEYQACTTIDELSAAQDAVMMPWKDHVGEKSEAWKRAKEITATHLERLGKANG